MILLLGRLSAPCVREAAVSRARDPRRARWLHLVMAISWTLLMVPTLLWWKNSILWVAMMSGYANIVGHWSAYQASRAETEAGSGGSS
jgi:hypothetical protein